MGRCRFTFYADTTVGGIISWPWLVGPSQPVEGSFAFPTVCQAGHELKAEEKHSGEMASGWRNQLPFVAAGQPAGFVILWRIRSAAAKGVRSQLSSSSNCS